MLRFPEKEQVPVMPDSTAVSPSASKNTARPALSMAPIASVVVPPPVNVPCQSPTTLNGPPVQGCVAPELEEPPQLIVIPAITKRARKDESRINLRDIFETSPFWRRGTVPVTAESGNI